MINVKAEENDDDNVILKTTNEFLPLLEKMDVDESNAMIDAALLLDSSIELNQSK